MTRVSESGDVIFHVRRYRAKSFTFSQQGHLQIAQAAWRSGAQFPETFWTGSLKTPSHSCSPSDSGSQSTSAQHRTHRFRCSGTRNVKKKRNNNTFKDNGSPHPDVLLHLQAVGLVLVLLDLSCYFGHFPSLAEVDQVFAVTSQEVGVAFLRLQDVG